VSPRPHLAHDRDPAKALKEELTQGVVVGNSGDGVVEQGHFVTLLGNPAADLEIVGWLVLKDGVATPFLKPISRGADGGAEGEFDSLELPIDKDSRVEVRQHADFLKPLNEGGFAGGNVETCDRADLGILEWGNQATEIIGLNADVAITDDEVVE
jgi:hypothetical protein